MNHRLGARLLAALLPAAALLLPATAHAETVSVDDAAGDAKAMNMGVIFSELLDGSTTDGPELLPAPAESSADVVRTTIDHARKRLTLTVQLRDLVDTQGHAVDFRIFTPRGRYDLRAGSYGGQGSADLSPARGGEFVINDDGTVTGPKPCRTVRARYDLAADTLTASVPNACLGSPKWVQVAAAVSRTRATPQADGSVNLAGYIDDAFRSRISENSLGRSPKVRRG